MGLSADKTLHAMEYMKNKEMILQHKYKYRRSNADTVETETTNRGSDNPASEVSIAGAGVWHRDMAAASSPASSIVIGAEMRRCGVVCNNFNIDVQLYIKM